MNHPDAYEVFKAQTENVRTLNAAIAHINRAINHALRKDDRSSAAVHTKVLAQAFSAWAEANFSKLIHTPYGFTPDEMDQIKLAHRQDGLESGWEKCLDLALRRVNASARSSELPNRRQTLFRIIRTYIIDPSLIRNKIAHGQWQVALNRENTAVNNDFTTRIAALDIITVSIWLQVYQYLAKIIEDLIESPNKTFHRDYWIHLSELESFLDKASHWTLNDKIRLLKRKPLRR
jgi:hypothetical protein